MSPLTLLKNSLIAKTSARLIQKLFDDVLQSSTNFPKSKHFLDLGIREELGMSYTHPDATIPDRVAALTTKKVMGQANREMVDQVQKYEDEYFLKIVEDICRKTDQP